MPLSIGPMNMKRTVLFALLVIFLTCVVHVQREAPQSVPERITSKDGAPMVLIPGGEFQDGQSRWQRYRAAFRNYFNPALTGSLVGFRCAADVE